MSKAEQKSIEWQKAHNPMAIGGANFSDIVDMYNVNPAYVAGYEQAEKDLALTWEDVVQILRICDDVKTAWWFTRPKDVGTQVFFEEALRRFNEWRNKK